MEQETQIRCIKSHNLPSIESSKYISFAGYFAYFIGVVDIFMSIYLIITDTVEELFSNIDLGLFGSIIVLLGYNCLSYQKGLSKKSQRYLLFTTIILIIAHCIIPFTSGLILGPLR